jgi:hypothetical protein
VQQMRPSFLSAVGRRSSDLGIPELPVRRFLHTVKGMGTTKVYWRFISGFRPIRSSQGRFGQIGHFMHIAQRRTNTGDSASG